MIIDLTEESVVALLVAGRIQMNLINVEVHRCQLIKDQKSLDLLIKQRTDLQSAIVQLWKGRKYDNNTQRKSPFEGTGS